MVYHLDASQRYYVAAGCYGSGTGSYQIRITSTANLDGVSANLSAATLTASSPGRAIITVARERKYFVFTAPTAKTYVFESSANGSCDPYGWLHSSSGGMLASNDNGAGNGNFRITQSLSAGQKVYLAAGCSGTDVGSFSVSVN
jgi:hypothetical protein